ncbi:MAG: Rrf2 family transcriptional regulator [Neisseriaceae bacterium]|nr:MAG: Rrf2 family transcriptional regulator [Neisseriaceae bacterium]
MQLTIFTDIAMKSIMYLKQTQDLVTINEIAAKFAIPRNHLIKVLNFMVHQEWIGSVRGRHGGLFYKQSSDELKLGKVIMLLENREELLNCEDCMLNNNCHLRNILHQAVDAFYDYLNQYTLADLNNTKTVNFINILKAN